MKAASTARCSARGTSKKTVRTGTSDYPSLFWHVRVLVQDVQFITVRSHPPIIVAARFLVLILYQRLEGVPPPSATTDALRSEVECKGSRAEVGREEGCEGDVTCKGADSLGVSASWKSNLSLVR